MELDNLSIADLQVLDRLIDERIPAFELLAYPRESALEHILFIFEQYNRQLERSENIPAWQAGLKKGYNALNHSVRWIHAYCLDNCQLHQAVDFAFPNKKVGSAASDLFFEAMNYGELWVQMSLLLRDRSACRKIEDSVYRIVPRNLGNRELDCSRMIVENAVGPKNHDEALVVQNSTKNFVGRRVKVERDRESRLPVGFLLDERTFSLLRDAIAQRSHLERIFDPDWSLGAYSFDDLWRFWLSLKVIITVETWIEDDAKQKGKDLNWFARARTETEWVQIIRRNSGLEKSIVREIIHDLTYDETKQLENNSLHVLFQPFFRLKGRLILSRQIFQIANLERNTWTLVGVLRPEVHDRLKNRKEQFWIDDLEFEMRVRGLTVLRDLRFHHEGKQGAIDLVLIDLKRGFGLVCELKWNTFTDDPKGVFRNDMELEKAVEQADRGCRWLEQNRDRLKTVIELENKFDSIVLKPLVISKKQLSSGYLSADAVPVINEPLLRWILIDPHQKSLMELWSIASTQSWLPERGTHFEDVDATILWGRFRFEVIDGAFRVLRKYNPMTDIRSSGVAAG